MLAIMCQTKQDEESESRYVLFQIYKLQLCKQTWGYMQLQYWAHVCQQEWQLVKHLQDTEMNICGGHG